MDIISLYTVIPNGEGLLALKHFFDLRTVKEPSSETLLRLAELVLTLFFSLNSCLDEKEYIAVYMKFACFTVFDLINYSTTFSNDDFSSFTNSTKEARLLRNDILS